MTYSGCGDEFEVSFARSLFERCNLKLLSPPSTHSPLRPVAVPWQHLEDISIIPLNGRFLWHLWRAAYMTSSGCGDELEVSFARSLLERRNLKIAPPPSTAFNPRLEKPKRPQNVSCDVKLVKKKAKR